MFRLIIAGALAVAVGLGMAATTKAGSGPVKQYHVLRQADYEAITGCVAFGWLDYARPLRSAIKFLVFAGLDRDKPNNDLQYARRHTLPLFRGLRHKHAGPDGAVAGRCIPPSLRQIAFALKFLDGEGAFGKNEPPKPDFTYDAALLKIGSISAKAFPVMSRSDYIATTGCKTSKKNYRRYREAFYWVVLTEGYQDKARDGMSKFLDVLYAWQRTTDGFVDQRCLIPAISRIAIELGLLDDKGRYQARRQ